MNDLSDLLRPDAVLTAITAPNRKMLFQLLGAAAGPALGVAPRLIAERLAEREKLGSTGFGRGVAIPHAKIDGVTQVTGVFVRLSPAIDFQAVDDLPVDLVFALLSPIGAGADHLKALARVSRRMRDALFLSKVRGAGSPDAVYALFATDEARDAA
ncbi:MAG TPA: PTS sugar transporter subunit IIA [Sphingomonas sp.]|jgi:PTS system nitrogen regulatory IIA component|nr:PTS sugar transporter subunit IIA [Sphingomonas sp.]